jgi:hypothetical protein
MCICLYVKYLLLLAYLNESNFLDRFSKNTHIIFNENPSSGPELFHANGRTDMTKLIVAFRNFAFAPKKETNPDVQLLLCYICLYTTRVFTLRWPVAVGKFRLREGGDAQTPDHWDTNDLAKFHNGFLDAFATLRKATVSFVMSFCLSAWNNSAPTGRICMNLYVWVFFFQKSNF